MIQQTRLRPHHVAHGDDGKVGPVSAPGLRVEPLLLETLVDPERFQGTCYRAANWVEVGLSAGRGRMDRAHRRHGLSPKKVFLYPLVRGAARRLRRS